LENIFSFFSLHRLIT